MEVIEAHNDLQDQSESLRATESVLAKNYQSFGIETTKSALETANKKIYDLSAENKVFENNATSAQEALSDLKIHTDYEVEFLSKQLSAALDKVNELESQLKSREEDNLERTVQNKLLDQSLDGAKQNAIDSKQIQNQLLKGKENMKKAFMRNSARLLRSC